jgi:hypothetical protein
VSLNSLALLHGQAGELDLARARADEGRALRRDLGDRRGIGDSLLTLARGARARRDGAARPREPRDADALDAVVARELKTAGS